LGENSEIKDAVGVVRIPDITTVQTDTLKRILLLAT
jgi:hypothetical protein